MNEKIGEFIKKNPDWYLEGGKLTVGFKFQDYTVVKEHIISIINLADKLDHHPTVTFGYNTIEVTTVTHDAGDVITERDFILAKAISEAVAG